MDAVTLEDKFKELEKAAREFWREITLGFFVTVTVVYWIVMLILILLGVAE